MITINIGTAESRGSDITARWIHDHVNARRKEGKSICVRFQIDCGDVTLNLQSRDCPTFGGGGGGRPPNRKEQRILDKWMEDGFMAKDINSGMVVSFWEFVKRFCS